MSGVDHNWPPAVRGWAPAIVVLLLMVMTSWRSRAQDYASLRITGGMTVLLITHDPEVAATLPRTITIRDGRIASEGRSGEEYAVVASDGSLPLPPHVAELLPAGTLVQVTTDDGEIRLTAVEQEGTQ